MAGLASRKRRAPDEDLLGDGSDYESTQAQPTPSRRKKKVRVVRDEDDDDDSMSDSARSNVTSLALTNATATIADTDTPHTVDSSTRSKSKPRIKRYFCTFPDCNKAFDRPIRLQTHINSHTGERPHVCPNEDCDKSFLKSEHLTRHLKEKHSDQEFVCTFKVRKDDTGEIEPCGKVFQSSNKLKRHVAVHEEKEETTCSWEGCGKVFRKQDTLQRHIKKDHLREDSYVCPHETPDGVKCGQAFPTPGSLKTHEARDHGAPRYICEICTNASPEEPMPVEDDLDPAFLPTAEDLQPVGDAFDPNAIGNLSLEDNTSGNLQHPRGIVCFATLHDFQRHNKYVHPPTCNECGKTCRSAKDLAAHMDIKHPNPDNPNAGVRPQPEKRFLCPYDGCARANPGNGFAKKGNLDVHIKSAHTKERNFTCGEYDLTGNKQVEGWNGQGCGMAFGAKQSMIGHIRTQHLGLPVKAGKTGVTKRKTKPKKGDIEDDLDAMDMDAVPGAPSTALAMLTGAGYEELRPHPCFLAGGPRGCQMRFTNEYELGTHMELTHEWNVDDINEALGNNVDDFGDNTDDMLRQRLEQEMDGGFNAGMIDPQLAHV